jgi:acetyl esterase/lipase
MFGPGPYPTVLTIHAGGFRNGDDTGEPHQRLADYDLAQAGFLVFSIEYRLAPPGLLIGQTPHCSGEDCTSDEIASGRPPEQSNDVKQQILAALADPQCNQEIFLVGGSSGGSHSLWAALDPNSNGVPGCGPTILTKIKAVVGFSGIYDLPLRDPRPSQQFIADVDNYTNTTESEADCVAKQYLASPISLVAAATNIPPVRLYATDDNSVPPRQSEEMREALFARGADVVEYTMSGSLHAFAMWHTINYLSTPPKCVSQEVIEFLQSHL